jgi:hypothetical protein
MAVATTTQGATTTTIAVTQITGNIQMSMDDAQADAAINDEGFKGAIKSSIAESAGNMSEQYVDLTISKASRRLTKAFVESLRRLATTLHIDYTISMPSTDFTPAQTQAAHSTISSVSSDALTQTVNRKVQNAGGNYTVAVTSIATPALVVPTVAAPATTSSSVANEIDNSKAKPSSKAAHALALSLSGFVMPFALF